ncbi:MAG: ABC transporter ATP-binding protein [Alkaliphilus sp.]
MLTYKNVTKKYDDNIVVNNLTLNFAPGTIVGLLGPNGAGKTTTIKMSCNLVKANQGEISAFGESLSNNHAKYMRSVGVVLEGSRNIYWNLTPKENMEYFAGLRGIRSKKIEQRVDNLLKLFQLQDKENERCGRLSKGMQQKVAIGCSIIHDPNVIFLDEPTIGLDVESVDAMEVMLKEIIDENKIIVITSHDLKFVSRICDRVVIINKGSVVIDEDIKFVDAYSSRIKYRIKLKNTNIAEVEKVLKREKRTDNNFKILPDELQISSETHDEIVRIINVLMQSNIEIISINKIEFSLKDVFMDVIKK